MKRLISAIVIAGVFLALNWYGESYSLKMCGEFMQQLDTVADNIIGEDYERANETLSELKNQWDKKSKTLSAFSGKGWPFVAGRDIDAIMRNMADENYAYALILIRESQSRIEGAKRGVRLSFGNIL